MQEQIFRNYDIRGIYPTEIDEDCAYIVGHYFGELCNGKSILIGFDGRNSTPILFDALVQGIIDAGGKPISLGLVPSPVLYFGNNILKTAASIMITASHNPKEYNGFKMMLNGESFFGPNILKLKEYALNSKIKYMPRKLDKIESINLKTRYIERIIEDIEIDPLLRIVWDLGNGAACSLVPDLVKKLPNENILIHHEIDGNFPSRPPDPTHHINIRFLAEYMRENSYDLGIAFDGDADRVVFVTSNGDILHGDQALFIFAEDILANNPSATIITEVKASIVLLDHIKKCGGRAFISKTGHSVIKANMKIEKALLAGELSGHIFFADKYYGFDDGIYAGMRMIDLLSRNSYSLANLYEKMPKLYNTPEIKIKVEESKKFEIVESIKTWCIESKRKFLDIDGVRYSNENGWWLVRASNTEPALTLRFESISQDGLGMLQQDLNNILQSFGIINTK